MLWSKRITLAVIFVAAAVFCLVAGHHWSLTVVLGLLFYILNNLVYAIFKV
jgi:F0F1-type ATP synthase assembly protein I